jgi:hypothetical protein
LGTYTHLLARGAGVAVFEEEVVALARCCVDGEGVLELELRAVEAADVPPAWRLELLQLGDRLGKIDVNAAVINQYIVHLEVRILARLVGGCARVYVS